MAAFEKFNFDSLDALRAKIRALGVDVGLSEDLSALARPVRIGPREAPNSIAILPMEGCDCEYDGSPSGLALRRYRRFAEGGAGLLWFEACAVAVEGRANPRQMHLSRGNVESFSDMVRMTDEAALRSVGAKPVKILQLTHSGRYARPFDSGAPMIAQHDPLLDPRVGITENYAAVTDNYLDRLQLKYVEAALLAREAGFDGVDIKACHRYLVSELLAARGRGGRYGGSFENRSRFALEVIGKVRAVVGDDFIVASRFNVFDAHPYPYGFGVDRECEWKSDLTEPLMLVQRMIEQGVNLLSNSAGNPYFRFPQVTRPFDQPVLRGEAPDEHPLESVARLFRFTREIQRVAGGVPVVGNGYSWLRQFIPYAGAANLLDGSCRMVGLGRQAFAYPDAPKDALRCGRMDPNKCCIACSKCTQIMRDHGMTGCVVRDGAVYAPLYREAREAAAGR